MSKWKWWLATAMAGAALGLLAGEAVMAQPNMAQPNAVEVDPDFNMGVSGAPAASSSSPSLKRTATLDGSRDEVLNQMREHSREIQRSLDELKFRAEYEIGEARMRLEARVFELERKRNELERQLRALRRASSRGWTRARAGVDRAWAEALSAARNARAEFEKARAERSLRE